VIEEGIVGSHSCTHVRVPWQNPFHLCALVVHDQEGFTTEFKAHLKMDLLWQGEMHESSNNPNQLQLILAPCEARRSTHRVGP
jgi:hypothetical protein